MKNNKIIIQLVTVAKLSVADISKIYKSQKFEIKEESITKLLEEKESCSFEKLGVFLDGFIEFKRGKSTNPNNDEVIELNNNLIFKKIRVALELKEIETLEAFKKGGKPVSKGQLSYFLRKQGHKNFRKLYDEELSSFLTGLGE